MESLYAPHLTETSSILALEGNALKHAQVLRLREGEEVLLANGAGLCAKAVIHRADKHEVLCAIQDVLPEHGELPFRLILALGILDNRERMEFAIEKAVEMGASDIVPVRTHNMERFAKNRIKSERLAAKAIAAMEQSHRSHTPSIHAPHSLEELFSDHSSIISPQTRIILADADGTAPKPLSSIESVCVCIGPEGGFSAQERKMLLNDPRTTAWNLAPRRLRAETAAMMCLTAVTLMIPRIEA
jgi:16S rRNA (uracil1498-N3)-methyltransferase